MLEKRIKGVKSGISSHLPSTVTHVPEKAIYAHVYWEALALQRTTAHLWVAKFLDTLCSLGAIVALARPCIHMHQSEAKMSPDSVHWLQQSPWELARA